MRQGASGRCQMFNYAEGVSSAQRQRVSRLHAQVGFTHTHADTSARSLWKTASRSTEDLTDDIATTQPRLLDFFLNYPTQYSINYGMVLKVCR